MFRADGGSSGVIRPFNLNNLFPNPSGDESKIQTTRGFRLGPLFGLTSKANLPYIRSTSLVWVLRSRYIFIPTPSPGLGLPSRAF